MKKNIIALGIFMFLVFVAGLVLIFSAPSIGLETGHIAVKNHGGSMDTNQFERAIDGTTFSCQMSGLVISLVSGFGSLVSGYVLYKEMRYV